MDKAKKRIASAFDGFRGNQASSATKAELNIKETLTSRDFNFARGCLFSNVEHLNSNFIQVVRHGFPHDPRCMAYDPVQRLLAIGSGNGSIRMYQFYSMF
jgi:syntaxin-binding protein 5